MIGQKLLDPVWEFIPLTHDAIRTVDKLPGHQDVAATVIYTH